MPQLARWRWMVRASKDILEKVHQKIDCASDDEFSRSVAHQDSRVRRSGQQSLESAAIRAEPMQFVERDLEIVLSLCIQVGHYIFRRYS